MHATERGVWLVVCAALAVAVAACREASAPRAVAATRPRSAPGVRVSMAALHQQGGVPLGWQLTMPAGDVGAGRADFERLGCPACHRVAGEHFANDVPEPRGPELTGMGSHHPAAYFAEALLDPDAVLIDEPGYLGEDGRSIMPTYADMTLGELADVVAYLGSLRADTPASCHADGATAASTALVTTTVSRRDRPVPPASAARVFFAQSYDVLPERLPELERWFASEGREAFRDAQGLVSMETFIDATKPSSAFTTIFGFRDDAALRTFVGDPALADVWKRFDALIGPHGHLVTDGPLIYRVSELSAE